MKVGENIYSEKSRTTYTILETLKSGGQAECAFATNDHDDKLYFVKRLLSIKYTERTESECKGFEKVRAKLYRQLAKESTAESSCPKIVDFFRENTFYYVVTERIIGIPCDTHELFKSLTIQERIDLFKIIIYSFYSLEKNGIVHGDVKPENLLLKRVNNHFVSKLIDMESAFCVVSPPDRGCIVGTDPYSSPELIDYNDENCDVEFEVTPKSDIFSLGVILYELILGHYPTSSIENVYAFEISKKHGVLDFDCDISVELKSVITSMLDYNPNKRPDVLTVLKKLKKIPDVSKPTEYCSLPQLIVERKSQEKAYVHILSVVHEGVIKVAIDDEAEKTYLDPILIEDDDVLLKAHVEVETSSGCLLLSGTLSETVSVVSEKTGKVDKPDINVNDGEVTITTSTVNALIYYTTDGKTPNRKSLLYTEPIHLPERTQVKAIALKRGMYNSDVVTRNTSSSIRMS